jgi:arylsulfatase A-like enzyme
VTRVLQEIFGRVSSAWTRRRRWLIAVGALLASAACSSPAASSARPRPNIVVVLVDDMRWDELGAAGHPFVQTPNMDRLAREGARFLNAFATTPLCSPSRASFLTGQYPHTNGIIDNTARPSHQMQTFPRVLQRAGYLTAFFGKWHMGNDDSPRPGFDHWVAMPGQGEAIDPQLNVDGERIKASGYVTDLLTDYVERFIQRAGDRPFLVYLAHKAIHPNVVQRDDGSVGALPGQPGGFVAAERHRGRYAGRVMPRRASAFKPPVGKPALLRRIGDLPPLGRETATTDEEIRGRLEMLLAVDDSLGRILAALEKKGTLDDTVVVFTSDHGYFYGEHGLSEERRLAYEEAIRIPFLVRYPQVVQAGVTPSEMVLSLDLALTLIELAGATQPSGAPVHGRSLVPIFKHAARGWRSSFLIEYFSDTVFPRVHTMGYAAVRTTRHKYIEYQELDGMNELYDLEADPYEERNLIERPDQRPVVERMQSELRRLKSETGYVRRP